MSTLPHVPDYLRVIRLGSGAGRPGEQACWMTALQSHLGGEWTDRCDCVDPVINAYCIKLNDFYADDNEGRTEDILEFGLFRPLGTAGDPEATNRRMWHAVDAAIRKIVPQAFDVCGLAEQAVKLRGLDRICDQQSANAACAAANAACAAARDAANATYAVSAAAHAAAHAAADATYAAHAAADAAANATYFADAADAAHAAAHAVAYAACAAACAVAYAAAARAHAAAKRKFLRDNCYPLLAELIEMGPHGPVELAEPVCGVTEFHRLVGVK